MTEQKPIASVGPAKSIKPNVIARMHIAERLKALDPELVINTGPDDYISLDSPNGKDPKNAIHIRPKHVSFLSHEATALRGEFEAAGFRLKEVVSSDSHPANKIRVMEVEISDIERHLDLFQRAVKRSRDFVESRQSHG